MTRLEKNVEIIGEVFRQETIKQMIDPTIFYFIKYKNSRKKTKYASFEAHNYGEMMEMFRNEILIGNDYPIEIVSIREEILFR